MIFSKDISSVTSSRSLNIGVFDSSGCTAYAFTLQKHDDEKP